jgi:DNA-binding response OmpR family regulator
MELFITHQHHMSKIVTVSKILIIGENYAIWRNIVSGLGTEYESEIISAENIGVAKAIHIPYQCIIVESCLKNTKAQSIGTIREKKKETPIIIGSIDLTNDQKLQLLKAGCDTIIEDLENNSYAKEQIISFLKRCYPEKIIQIKSQGLYMNTNTQEVMYKRKKIRLRKKHFMMLAFLASQPNKIFTREQLYRHIWGTTKMESNLIDTHIKQLRKQIGDTSKDLVRTIHSQGYTVNSN